MDEAGHFFGKQIDHSKSYLMNDKLSQKNNVTPLLFHFVFQNFEPRHCPTQLMVAVMQGLS